MECVNPSIPYPTLKPTNNPILCEQHPAALTPPHHWHLSRSKLVLQETGMRMDGWRLHPKSKLNFGGQPNCFWQNIRIWHIFPVALMLPLSATSGFPKVHVALAKRLFHRIPPIPLPCP
jgi:hypothetical protein